MVDNTANCSGASIEVNVGIKGVKLREGYTTGACAAAAAKAATVALRAQSPTSSVSILLPQGQSATFDVVKCSVQVESASCAVIKDAGDDPDVTHGAEIGAIVRWVEDGKGIAILGGEGVGTVTKPGLGLEIGGPAINPVPREMITYSVREALGDDERRGVEIVIYVPAGAQLAKRTLNARLGIIGGISILGTTGIVKPYSTAAYIACIVQGINVALANGCEHLVLTTGRRSEKFAQRLLDLPEEAFIQVGDFVGTAIEECATKGVRRITMCGMVGKLSKIASGFAQTHADNGSIDPDFLVQLAADAGMPSDALESIRGGNTVRGFGDIVLAHGAERIFSVICAVAAGRLGRIADEAVEVDVIMTDFDGKVLGKGCSGGSR
ncbi:MAG: cobalt-precorrin-5B (C(1))-methyltransferase [Chloroflexi bacterium]|nr:cobalt-precorrin-5B (C(1))-methyltransferase [Chloroflexota bacterium]